MDSVGAPGAGVLASLHRARKVSRRMSQASTATGSHSLRGGIGELRHRASKGSILTHQESRDVLQSPNLHTDHSAFDRSAYPARTSTLRFQDHPGPSHRFAQNNNHRTDMIEEGNEEVPLSNSMFAPLSPSAPSDSHFTPVRFDENRQRPLAGSNTTTPEQMGSMSRSKNKRNQRDVRGATGNDVETQRLVGPSNPFADYDSDSSRRSPDLARQESHR